MFWAGKILLIWVAALLQVQQPTDTVSLWQGKKIPFGKEVSLYAFRPEQPNGISVVVCPGGSYHWHDMDSEGV